MATGQILKNASSYSGQEHRKHERFPCNWPLRICELGTNGNQQKTKKFNPAKSKNLSKSGIKITTLAPLERHSNALLDIPESQIGDLLDADHIVFVAKKRLLAEVAWRRLNLETGLFEAGLRFIEENERDGYRPVIARAHLIP